MLFIRLFAHKKGVGSTRNGRDSEAKRLGPKRADGQSVLAGNISSLLYQKNHIASEHRIIMSTVRFCFLPVLGFQELLGDVFIYYSNEWL